MKLIDWLQSLKFRRPSIRRNASRRNQHGHTVPTEALEKRELMSIDSIIVAGAGLDEAQNTAESFAHSASQPLSPVADHPDVMVTSLNVVENRVDSGTATVQLMVTNQGLGPAIDFDVALIHSDDELTGNEDDQQLSLIHIDSLPSGQSRFIETSVSLDRATLIQRSLRADTGTDIDAQSAMVDFIAAVADPDNRLFESNAASDGSADANNANRGMYRDRDQITALAADINGDGQVTPRDALSVISNFDQIVDASNQNMDLNGDGNITPRDALTVIKRFGYQLNTSDQLITLQEDTRATVDLKSLDTFQSMVSWTVKTDPVHGSVSLNSDTGVFTYVPNGDFHGADALEFSAITPDGISNYVLDLLVNPVNDKPELGRTLADVSVKAGTQSSVIDISGIFTDVDGEILEVSVAENTNKELVTASVNGTALTLNYSPDAQGQAEITIQASDAALEIATTTFNVAINGAPVQLDYALASDQIIEYHGRNLLRVPVNLPNGSRVDVHSVNETVLPSEDVQATVINGEVFVDLNHRTEEYGATHLTLSHNGLTFSDLTALVLPESGTPASDAGEPVLSTTQEATDDGVVITKRVNTRFLAHLVEQELILPEDAIDLARPADPIMTMTDNVLEAPRIYQDVNGNVTFVRISLREAEPPVFRTGVSVDNVFDSVREFRNGYVDAGELVGDLLDGELPDDFGKPDAESVHLDASELLAEALETQGNKDGAALVRDVVALYKDGANVLSSYKDIKGAVDTLKTVSKLPLPPHVKVASQAAIGLYIGFRGWQAFESAGNLRTHFGRIANNPLIRDVFGESSNTESPSVLKTSVTSIGNTTTQVTKQFHEASQHKLFRLHVSDSDVEYVDAVAQDPNAYDAQTVQKAGVVTDVPPEAPGSNTPLLDTASNIYSVTKLGTSIFSSISDIFGSFNDDDDFNDNTVKNGTPDKDVIQTGNGNDKVYGKGGDDRLSTGSGADELHGGRGYNRLFAGPGNDKIFAGPDGDTVIAGGGRDIVTDQGGNDVFSLDTGLDELHYDTDEIGHDILIDPDRSGKIFMLNVTKSALDFRRDGRDLEILVGNTVTVAEHSIRFAGYFNSDRSDWTISTSDSEFKLYEATGRLKNADALKLALQSYKPVADYANNIPIGYRHLTTVTSPKTGLHAELFVNKGDGFYEAGEQLIISVRGSNDPPDWIINNPLGGIPQANDLIDMIPEHVDITKLKTLSLTGHSAGGMAAEWVGAYGAAAGVPLVDVTTVNSPDVSGLITGLIGDEYSEYANGFQNMTVTHLVGQGDVVSRIGLFSGHGIVNANWATWSDSLEPNGLMTIDDILNAHTPVFTDSDFDTLDFRPLTYEEIQSHVSLNSIEDLTSYVYLTKLSDLADKAVTSVSNLFELFLDGEIADSSEDTNLEHDEARQEFLKRLSHDPYADVVFNERYDFGTGDSNLAQEFERVTADTEYSEEKGFGWASTKQNSQQDRGKANDVQRDFVGTKQNEFIIDVPAPGTYNIAITMGDRNQIREAMELSINGYSADVVSTMPGQFLTRTFQASTVGSQLRIGLRDRGGETARAVINGLTVERVHYGSVLPPGSQVQDDASLVVLTHGYTLPEGVDAIINVLKATVKQVLMSALTGFAGNIVSFAGTTFQGLGTFSSLSPAFSGLKAGAKAVNGFLANHQVIERLKVIDKGLKIARDRLVQAPEDVRSNSRVHDWVFEMGISLSQMSRKFRLGSMDPNLNPVDFGALNKAIENGKTGSQLLKHWKGSRDFVALDWTKESNDGVGFFDSDESRYRNTINKAARAYKKLIEARIEELQENDPTAELDVLLVAHGFGYNVNRELVRRLDSSALADSLDYVKFVSLDPISMNPDELKDSKFKSDRYHWYHPEMTVIVDAVHNVYQTEGIFNQNVWQGGFLGRLVTGSLEKQLTFGQPLDGRVGGGTAGFYNRQARVFDLESSEELLRFRHWDTNTLKLSTAEMTDVEFSPDGTLIAAAGKDGNVTVRDAESGEIRFTVWGHRKSVNSVAFSGDGQFLLTISRENGVVLLTRVEDGTPVWKGEDQNGTQIEMSPEGDLIVSADSNGFAKIWRRTGDTFSQYDIVNRIAAHSEGIRDLEVISRDTFVTAGADKKIRVWRVNAANQITAVDDAVFTGKARSLDYNAAQGILAVGSGRKLSLWKVSTEGRLSHLVTAEDHIRAIQGVSFSRDGNTLVTGGEDRTLFVYSLDTLSSSGLIRKNVISGNMLPIREVAIDPDGQRVVIVGIDNIEDSELTIDELVERLGQGHGLDNILDGFAPVGGPVKDTDATARIDKRIGFSWTELFVGGLREHNDVPFYYMEEIVADQGESFFWQRNNTAANRPGDLDRDRNKTLPPNKQTSDDGVEYEPINIYVRPGGNVDIYPRRYLIDADRADFQIKNVEDASSGDLRQRNEHPNILRYVATDKPETVSFDVTLSDKPRDEETPAREVVATVNVHVINHAPTANEDSITVYAGHQEEIFPRKNDYDFDGDSFEISDVDASKLSKVRQKQEAPNTLVYRAGQPDFTGSDGVVEDSFQYTVKDRFGSSSTGTIRVRILQPEEPSNLETIRIAAGRKQFRVKWDAPEWNVKRYKLELFEWNTATAAWSHEPIRTPTVDGGEPLRHDFANLKAGTKYLVRVTAANPDVGEEGIRTAAELVHTTEDFETPVITTIKSTAPQKVQLTWEHSGEDVDSFLIRKKKGSGEWSDPVTVKAQDRTVEIGPNDMRFVPGVTYDFEVRAKYPSKPISSESRPVRLQVATPPSNVRVEMDDIRRKQATVRWNAPNPDWQVKGYDVKLYVAQTGELVRDTRVAASSVDNYRHDFSNLASDTNYKVAISAKNSDLDVESEVINYGFQTRGFSAPIVVAAKATGPQEVFLEWQHDREGVSQFIIRKQKQDHSWTAVKTVNGNTTRTTIKANSANRLVPGREYQFVVRAVYSSTEQRDSVAKLVPLQNATPPNNIQASADGRQKMTVRWDAPNPTWQVASYKIRLFKSGSQDPVREKTVSGTRTVQFANLDAGTSYIPEVTAVNKNLDGAQATAQGKAVSTDSFYAPTITALTSRRKQIDVEWSHPDELKNFVIRYRRSGSSTWETKAVSGSTSATLSGLAPGKKYFIVVRAKYADHNEDSSMEEIKTNL